MQESLRMKFSAWILFYGPDCQSWKAYSFYSYGLGEFRVSEAIPSTGPNFADGTHRMSHSFLAAMSVPATALIWSYQLWKAGGRTGLACTRWIFAAWYPPGCGAQVVASQA